MSPRSRGFGLLEMLASLAVFGLGCTVLLLAFGQAARTLEQVRGSDRLALTLRTLVDDQRDRPLRAGTTQGIDGGVAWSVRITREPGARGSVSLYKMQATVEEAGRTLSASTLFVQSTPDLSR